MRIITGTVTNGVTLAVGDSPVLVGGVVTNDSTVATSAVYGGAGVYADIRNLGTVGDTTQTYIGIKLAAAGTITNGSPTQTKALIEGSSYALELAATSTVTNFGSIVGPLSALFLKAGGKIVNGSTADITAQISAGNFGALFQQLGAVTNFGTVTASKGYGIDLIAGGNVANGSSADTRAVIAGSRDGVVFVTAIGTVNNFGTIMSIGSASASGGYNAGIGALSSVTAVRIANGSSTSTKALISGSDGIDVTVGSIANFGTVTGTGPGGEAIYLGAGTILNGGTASTAALLHGDFVGAYLAGGGRITNFGEIEGGVGVLLRSGGTVVNGSGADPTALIGNALDGIDVAGASATITNFGTIEGYLSAISFSSGDDKLIVEPGATFIGAVDGDAGTDTARFVGGGTLAIRNFSGFENFVLSAASADTLRLTNANFAEVTGSTITVTAGRPGDTVNAAAVTGSNDLVFVGGVGADKVAVRQHATMTGRGGADIFTFSTRGIDNNTITDFAHSTDKITFSDAGFHLGLSGAGSTLTALPAKLFSSNTTGNATNSIQRFIYDTGNGHLFYDADGSGTGSSRQLIVTLTGHPTLAASDLFFVS